MSSTNMILSVGPVTYYWPRDTLVSFYSEVADSAATTVCLGEVICSRRHEMKSEDWLDLARDLRAAGKEVVIGTQALIESEADLRMLRRWAEHGEHWLEANDAAAVRLVAGRAPWVIGSYVNVYSAPALDEYRELGAQRWVPPVELPLEAIGQISAPAGDVATEVFAFGRLPLALSARCFTARHLNLQKDDCQFRCIEHPDGLLLSSREGQPFLALNGIQTQSAAVHSLLGQRDALRAAGIGRLRLSPTSHRFADVLDAFDAVMNRGADPALEQQRLVELSLPGPLVNGFSKPRTPGMNWIAA